MLFRLQFILLTAACALAAQDVTAPTGAHTIHGAPHDAVWISEAGPGGPTGAISLHGADVRFEGPPVTGAPYSADAVTEVVQTLADGNRIRRESRTKIYRDNEGRTRREEKLQPIGPWAEGRGGGEMIFINDPVAGVHWVINPQDKTARKMPVPQFHRLSGGSGNMLSNVYSQSFELRTADGESRKTTIQHSASSSSSSESSADSSDSPSSSPAQVHIQRMARPVADSEAEIEQLGERTIEGVLADGVRRTRTIKAGEIGNERPIEVVFEEWRSEEMGVTVKSVRSDPRSGVTTYTLENIQRTNPLPTLFEPPAGYEIIEMPAFARAKSIEFERK